MTAFVLRRLQRANEKVQDEISLANARGIGGTNAREPLLLAQGDGSGHISDRDSDESDFDYEGEDLGFWTGPKVVGSPVNASFDGRQEQTVN
ncbi:hypothetical protein D9619_011501 [Psilocybe cf. subviscida]|uniref:Uncharacterized protein n=1 Tax=Psilocybe cf. subviscida TaxID=2480587 RepID=A0A8H5BSM7_9AGAR|nr:hypothetical protein D9619_011501 [Psilocybe cf. subviscida]